MENQNFKNHPRYAPGFNFTLLPIVFICMVLSAINAFMHLHDAFFITSLFIPVIFICVFLLALLARTFALKAQSRAIRAEENLRYFVHSGKLLPAGLTINQITALRFAPDAEFVPLVDKASSENMAPAAIKQAIQNWKGDYFRV